MNFIDFSQTKNWWKCPYYWYERYVNQVEKLRPNQGYRDDAMAFGSLVHSGLENWTKAKTLQIAQEVIDEIHPSPELVLEARTMLQEYVQRYPTEEFPIHKAEEPLMFPLLGETAPCPGLAKLDAYFYVPTLTTLESGIPGETITLEPGWWLRDYKTKSASINRGYWALAWQMILQADFQILALQHYVDSHPTDLQTLQASLPEYFPVVRGLLVSVLERARMYIPKRKCKGPACGQTLELASYLDTGAGHACPLCGFVQELSPYKPKVEHRPEFFRVRATRSRMELHQSRQRITLIAKRMQELIATHGASESPNMDSCVDNRFGACEFFEPHKNMIPTIDNLDFQHRDATKYVGLTNITSL